MTSEHHAEKNNPVLILALMVIIGGAVYLNTLTNGFHYDDGHHITGNPNIRSLQNIPRFFVDPGTFSGLKSDNSILYRPLLLTSHAINYAIGGYNPAGYHVVNLSFHVGSAFLIFLIVQAMVGSRLEVRGKKLEVRSEKQDGGVATYFAALAAGMIFLVHPFNSEVVNYISARSSVMCAFFYLMAFYFWVKFRSEKLEVRSKIAFSNFLPLTSYFYLASLLAFLLAMLTKEIAITLPAMFFLYDMCFREVRSQNSGARSQWVPYLPFLSGVIFPFLAVRKTLTGSVGSTFLSSGYYEHLLTQLGVLFHYIRLLFVPSPLSVVHVIPVSSGIDVRALFFSILLSSLLALAIWLYSRGTTKGRIVSFFISWFFISLLPTTLVPLTEILQENRGYLSGISFAVISGISLDIMMRRIGVLKNHDRTNKILYGFLILLLGVYSIATISRNAAWKNDITLWSDTVRKAPSSFRARYSLASAYSEAKQYGLAEREYMEALKINPASMPAHYNLGIAYIRLNKLDLALIQLEKAGSLSRDDPAPYVTMGDIFASRKEWMKAKEAYQKAIQRDPDHPKALSNIGIINIYRGEYSDAISYLNKALLTKPGWREVEIMLAYAMEKAGRSSEARAIYRKNTGDREYTALADEVRRYFSAP